MINLPDNINLILSRLEAAGFAAYCVGGCVRDSFMNKEPLDWDICTSAEPQETVKVFEGFKTVNKNGLKHGTVTVILESKPYEITTFRTDGEYLDNRRPESVTFVKSIEGDLARRDFTINAMAFSPKRGFIDLFGGSKDIKNGIIKCVGDAEKRFHEDALRIMRALRFASVLGFEIESKTANAAILCRGLLKNISAERICAEFLKLMEGKAAEKILKAYPEIFAEILPQPFIGDYFTAATEAGRQTSLKNRAAVFLHLLYECPEGVKTAAKKLKMSRETTNFLINVSRNFDLKLPTDLVAMRHLVKTLGTETLDDIAGIKGDASAAALLDEIKNKRLCCSLKELKISGGELKKLGIKQGKAVGIALERLLNDVIDEKVENNKSSLTEYTVKLKETGEITDD